MINILIITCAHSRCSQPKTKSYAVDDEDEEIDAVEVAADENAQPAPVAKPARAKKSAATKVKDAH